MTSFLLLLSFLIHLILFITIYHIYEKTKRDKDEQAKQLENMLANFMKDIRHENNKLEQKIRENDLRQNINYESTPTARKQPFPTQEIVLEQGKTSISSDSNVDRVHDQVQTNTYSNTYVSDRQHPTDERIAERMKQTSEDIIETSLEGQVMHLIEAGKTVEEIAKQLNRGKTEIELLIKLNRTAKN